MFILILFILATLTSHLNEEIFTSIFPFKSNLLFEYIFKIINFTIEIILVMLGIGIIFHFGNLVLENLDLLTLEL